MATAFGVVSQITIGDGYATVRSTVTRARPR